MVTRIQGGGEKLLSGLCMALKRTQQQQLREDRTIPKDELGGAARHPVRGERDTSSALSQEGRSG